MITKSFLSILLIVAILFSSLGIPTQTFACTIFSINQDNQRWVGRTFDWSYGQGALMTNARGVFKKSLRLLPQDVSTSWTSKYGSLTFNQFGKELPLGGMNETGLMIEALELKTSIFSSPNEIPSLNELQFIQYILDNFQTIEEIKKSLSTLRISAVGSQLHYFTCDIHECLTIESINGKWVTHSEEELPIPSLANNTYEQHLNYIQDFENFGGIKPINMESKESLDRFVRGTFYAQTLKNYSDKIEKLFDFLNDVGTKNNRWQIIYNQTEGIIHFRTTAKFSLKRFVDLKRLNFDCHKKTKYFDLESDFDADITDLLKDLSNDFNYALIKKSVELQKLPLPLADRLANYSTETQCQEK